MILQATYADGTTYMTINLEGLHKGFDDQVLNGTNGINGTNGMRHFGTGQN